MHVPDGYFSPLTSAVMYAAAIPFWAVALRRTRRLMNTRMLPLLSVFAAFSFVVMMFNIPVPGGTTAHAIGMAVAAIVLGPWAAVIAISVALVIQSLFFGDGGITAIGANCFNMAIAAPLIAYGLYRLISGRTPIQSSRRVAAAAVAGYAANNIAGLLTAVQLGIQPIFFTDASGAPLYAPYPLSVAIPAMLLGHLTLGGMAEAIVSGGVVAYLQRADPSLLKLTAPDSREAVEGDREIAGRGWLASRPLWIGLAILMIFTPLGLLAGGAAWGEWSPQDFNDPAKREEIKAASYNWTPPSSAPSGYERLSSIWTAPMPGYAPPFMKNESFGYILSAIFGTGLIIAAFLLLGWLSWAIKRGRETESG